MSRTHILTGSNGTYSFVVHQATPAGNNSAGVAWSDALVASGMARTDLTAIGTGPGQITQAERDQIVAGAVIEARGTYDETGLSGQALTDDFTLRATQAMNDRLNQLADQLKWFGLTIA